MRVPPGGYAWWYVDALSDDGRFGLSLIAFIGSVFSPYYALAQRRAATAEAMPDPEQHVALNVATYGPDGYRWAMTERGRTALRRDDRSLRIGKSHLIWATDGTLSINFDEIAVPWPRRVRGQISVRPCVLGTARFQLDPAGHHLWQPIAPRATVEVSLDSPRSRWSGSAYIDHNHGSEPLAAAFRSWNWSRSIESERTRIFYDVVQRSGASSHLHLDYTKAGTPTHITAKAPLAPVRRSAWRLERAARTDDGTSPRLLETWEDGPFYARALIEQHLEGQKVRAVHEALSLDRFSRGIVQAMLPFRMPRSVWSVSARSVEK